MNPLPFLLRYVVPLVMVGGWMSGALWLFKIVPWLWVAVTILDTVVGPDTSDPPSHGRPSVPGGFARRLDVTLWIVSQAVMLGCGLALAACRCTTIADLALVTVSIGVATGIFSVSAAHELMHGPARFERALATAIMTMMSYGHFGIAHVEGHHRTVGTPADPATARWGESFYAFYNRTLIGGVVTAWRIEARRLRRRGTSVWSGRNRVLGGAAVLTAVYVVVAALAGVRGLAFFAVQSIVAFSLVELFNYVEHYGLARRPVGAGRYERVRPWHSWNSSHRFSNWLLLNLGRHADHHCRPERRYDELRHAEDAPQLPAGYFGVFVLPFIPALWRRVIDPRVHAWRVQHGVPLDVLAEAHIASGASSRSPAVSCPGSLGSTRRRVKT
jgi:alkane 1-monooxygenase